MANEQIKSEIEKLAADTAVPPAIATATQLIVL